MKPNYKPKEIAENFKNEILWIIIPPVIFRFSGIIQSEIIILIIEYIASYFDNLQKKKKTYRMLRALVVRAVAV